MARTLKRAAAFTALGRALMSGRRGGPSVPQRLSALPRMLKATAKGEYDGGLRLAMMAGAAAYIISPIDLIPEFIPVLGPIDDIVVAVVAMRFVRRRMGVEDLRRRWSGSPGGFELLLRVIGAG